MAKKNILRKALLCPFFFTIIFTGCKKNESAEEKDLVRSVNNNGNATIIYTYDNNGLLTGIGNSTLSWSQNSVLVDAGDLSGNYTRNNNGYISSRSPSPIETYTYNTNNQLVSFTINGVTITFNWEGGNHISSVGIDAGLTNEYYMDKTDNRDFGLKYAPYLDMIIRNGGYSALPGKNLLKKSGNNEYTYEFDDNDRISKMIITASSGYQEVYTYTYY